MNYDEAIEYIETVSCSGIMPGLVRIQALLEKTEHPEKKCNVIHVAGTNGKGSVCSYISSILMKAGYRVGRYVSPTLFDYRERIQINDSWISKADTAYWMSRVREADKKMQAEGMEGASAFELETVMAFLYFKASRCDFVVLETGMGGRLDATNVVPQPLVSVITSIGMDHMKFLGDTIEAIASEKGGIIKDKRPAVIGAGRREAVDTLVEICHQKHCRYRIVDRDAAVIHTADLYEGQIFDYENCRNVRTVMAGCCQPWNASIAIAAVELLCELPAGDFPAGISKLPGQWIDQQKMAEGIASARWPGRFEVLEDVPPLIIDGAHNPDGVKSLIDSIALYLRDWPVILVMGVFADKDYTQMLEMVSAYSNTLIAFKPGNPRGLSSDALAERASHYFKQVTAAASQEEALKTARKLGAGKAAIVCFGSLSTMAGWYQLTGRKSSDGEY